MTYTSGGRSPQRDHILYNQAAQNGGVSDNSGSEKMKGGNDRGEGKEVEAGEVRMWCCKQDVTGGKKYRV